MKSFAFATLLSLIATVATMASSTASAWPGQEKYIVKKEGGVQYVLFPEHMTTGILSALKSVATVDQKKALINGQIFIEIAKIDDSPTFCTVAGPIYKTPNRDEAETTAKCEELLQKPSFAKMLIEDPPENLATITPLEYSEQISKIFAMMIQLF
ncbi:MAG: hypothetical protein U1E10_04935 [Bdellovibrionales bacterium]|nr:hypothetical protein [Bdellovibrionales bacterium]